MMTMSGQQRQKYRNKQQTLDIIRTQTTSIGEVKACWAMKLQLEQNRNWARKCAGHRKHRRVHQKHSTQNELMNDSTNVGLTQKNPGAYISTSICILNENSVTFQYVTINSYIPFQHSTAWSSPSNSNEPSNPAPNASAARFAKAIAWDVSTEAYGEVGWVRWGSSIYTLED